MSALARYFHHEGHLVAGYDRTRSALTRELEEEGIEVIYDDQLKIEDWRLKIADFSAKETIVVRTPAVPEEQPIYTYFRENGYTILKRSEVLGQVTRQKKALCVAGTHGKTTTSTMLAHILAFGSMVAKVDTTKLNQQATWASALPTSLNLVGTPDMGINAFLGGISNNYGTNLLLSKESEYVVVEADEYDRSFHQLRPYISVITSIDPDHLDIYGSAEAYQEGFDVYAGLVEKAIILKKGYGLRVTGYGAQIYTYSVEEGDFHAANIRVGNGTIVYDLVTPDGVVTDIELGVPVWVNIENSIAAMAAVWVLYKGEGLEVMDEGLRRAMKSYKGVYRRFDIHVKTDKVVYIDDYAHHPTELRASMDSVRRLYPDRRFIVVFQPHLYTRTRDFMHEFAEVLHTADELILLPIYPAREKPIPGVSSECLGGEVVEKKDLVRVLKERVEKSQEPVVVLTVGAGDIDRLVPDVSKALEIGNW